MSKQEEATLLLRIKQAGKEILDRFVITMGDVVDMVKSASKALFEFSKRGPEIDSVRSSFENLAISQGQSAKKILDSMRELSAGTVSDLELMKKANTAFMLGLPVDKFGEMLTIARSASKATGESMEFMLNSIVTGLGRGSKLMLDNLGIVFDIDKAYEEYARSLNKTVEGLTEAEKKQAFINKALAIGVENANKAGGGTENLADKYQQLTATIENLLNRVSSRMGPFFAMLADAANATARFATGLFRDSFTASEKSISELTAEMGRLNKEIQRTEVLAQSMARTGGDSMVQVLNQLEQRRSALAMEIEKSLAMERAAAQQKVDIEKNKNNELTKLQQERAIADQDRLALEQEMLYMNNEQLLQAQIRQIDQMLSLEQSAANKRKLIKDRAILAEKLAQETAWKQQIQQHAYFIQQEAELVGALSQLATAIMDSESKALFLMQQGLALAQTWMLTQVAAMQAMASIPWPANLTAAANIESIGYIKMAAIGATTLKGLAEGGIVKARPGGAPFIIGEGGRDEAVIPLEDGRIPGGGNTFVFNGPILGDQQQAREFASWIDRELLSLRRRNESVAFEDVA